MKVIFTIIINIVIIVIITIIIFTIITITIIIIVIIVIAVLATSADDALRRQLLPSHLLDARQRTRQGAFAHAAPLR